MREVVVDRCVAACDERHEHEQDAARGEPVWCMAPHFCCACHSSNEYAGSFIEGVVRVADAC
eukprot:2804778-Pleurochrysis_carterae.AAC.1